MKQGSQKLFEVFPLPRWKKWSTTRRIASGSALILFLIYIFCLPQKLFDVPYATVVTDRNGELLGARIAADGQWRFPPFPGSSRKSKDLPHRV